MRRVGVVREEVASRTPGRTRRFWHACEEVRATWSNFLCSLDLRLCGTLVQRLKHVVQAWCAEFDASVDDGELQRDPILSKCRGDKQWGEKVSVIYITEGERGAHDT